MRQFSLLPRCTVALWLTVASAQALADDGAPGSPALADSDVIPSKPEPAGGLPPTDDPSEDGLTPGAADAEPADTAPANGEQPPVTTDEGQRGARWEGEPRSASPESTPSAEPATLFGARPTNPAISPLSRALPAPQGDLRLSIDLSPVFARDARLDAVQGTGSAVVQTRAGAGYRSPLGWSVHLMYTDAQLAPSFTGTIAPSLQSRGLDTGVRWDMELWGHVRPYASAVGGVRAQTLRVATPAGALESRDWVPAFFGGLGVEFVIPFQHVQFLLHTEHGYHWQPEARFDDARAGGAAPVDLGAAQMQGYLFRLGASVAFPF